MRIIVLAAVLLVSCAPETPQTEVGHCEAVCIIPDCSPEPCFAPVTRFFCGVGATPEEAYQDWLQQVAEAGQTVDDCECFSSGCNNGLVN